MIAVIDICGNNLNSLRNALLRLQSNFIFTHSLNEIQKATHVILPGVGSAAPAMEALRSHNLISCLQHLNTPILGICLGMQLLFESSEEGDVAGLGILPGQVKQLQYRPGFPVPHMGWNRLQWKQNSNLHPTGCDDYVYFVHSYAVPININTIAGCEYTEEFTAIVQKDNVIGMQFHPEKSAAVGLQLLNNFIKLESI
jgi:glutamine amidotransferase